MPACPHCGHETEAEVCPLCGSAVAEDAKGARGREPGASREPGPASGGPRRAADGTAATGVAERPGRPDGRAPPFEDPGTTFLRGLALTWKESVFEPKRFFSGLGGGGIAQPILYFLLMTVVGAFFTMLWQSLWVSLVQVDMGVMAGTAAASGPVISFLLSPFAALMALLFAVVVYHLGALMLAPERQGMGATARVVCYAAGPAVFSVVPILGSLVATVWTVVLQVVGLREVHRTTTGRSLLIVFWLPITFMVLGIVLVFLAIAFSNGGGNEAVPVIS